MEALTMADRRVNLLRKFEANLREALTKALPEDALHFDGSLTSRAESFRVCVNFDPENVYRGPQVTVWLDKIRRKVEARAPRGSLPAEAKWEETDRRRICVVSHPQPGRNFYEKVNGEFSVEPVLRAVVEQLQVAKAEHIKAQAKQKGQEHFSEVVEQLDKIFQFSGTLETTHDGRHHHRGISLESHPDGITIWVRKRLTEEEARVLLRTIDSLGLFPGGVRLHDRPVSAKTLSRFERIK